MYTVELWRHLAFYRCYLLFPLLTSSPSLTNKLDANRIKPFVHVSFKNGNIYAHKDVLYIHMNRRENTHHPSSPTHPQKKKKKNSCMSSSTGPSRGYMCVSVHLPAKGRILSSRSTSLSRTQEAFVFFFLSHSLSLLAAFFWSASASPIIDSRFLPGAQHLAFNSISVFYDVKTKGRKHQLLEQLENPRITVHRNAINKRRRKTEKRAVQLAMAGGFRNYVLAFTQLVQVGKKL